MTTKTGTKLTAAEIKSRRVTAEIAAGYAAEDRSLIGGKNTEAVAQETLDYLLVADLDAARSRLKALIARERANRWTFHPGA